MTGRSRFDALADLLEVLASPVRLEIIHAAREPRAVAELRVAAGRTRKGEHPDRPLARQTVAHHVAQLEAAGLLRRLPTTDERAEAVCLDHARLFALVDEMRALAKLRPLHAPAEPGATVPRATAHDRRLPAPPRLMVAYGRDDGLAFPLSGPTGSRFRIGRARGCEVCLDYDPYASAENAAIERTKDGFVLRDLGSRNGTWLDWERLPAKSERPLHAGALVAVGRSLLVFQDTP